MVNSSIRFPHIRRAAITALILSLILGLGLIGFGVATGTDLFHSDNAGPWMVAVTYIAAGVLLLAWTIGLWCVIDLIGKVESTDYRAHDVLLDVKASLDEHSRRLADIAENTQLSDAARSIAHREREQNVLRQAINEDILREDWEAAYYLVDQLERRFGYKLEAGQLRNEIDTSRTTLIARKVDEAVDQVKNLMAAHDWERARRHMAHLVKRYSNHPGVKALPQDFERLRAEQKRRLLKEMDEAGQRGEVDRRFRLLKELDLYVTPHEAQEMQPLAEAVIDEQKKLLGAQFKMAWEDQQWERAMDIAHQIIKEFPKSGIASEVRELMPVLQQRAARRADAGAAKA